MQLDFNYMRSSSAIYATTHSQLRSICALSISRHVRVCSHAHTHTRANSLVKCIQHICCSTLRSLICHTARRERQSGQRVHYIKSTPISLPLFMYVRLSLPLPLPLVFVNILRQRNEANESSKKLFSWQPKNEGTLPLLVCAGVRKH